MSIEEEVRLDTCIEQSGRGSSRHSDSLWLPSYCIRQGNMQRRVETRRGILLYLQYLNEHPSILGWVAWRDIHFNTQLIMPLYDQDLRKLLRPNGVKADVVVKISRDLLFALQYLGMTKVLRRDIKPAHILVQRQPLAAILGDFGAARYVSPIIASHKGVFVK